MKLFKSLLALSLAPVLFVLPLLSGCSTTGTAPVLTPALVTVAVETGVSFGLNKYPQATPYVRAAAPVVCAAANSTNIQPAQLVVALENAGVINSTNTEAVLIVNGVLAVYDTVFASYGNNWLASQTQLQGYLKAVCDGMNAGLPPANLAARSKPLPPHLK